MTDVCPTCGQALPQAKGKRICADYQRQIRRRDKWHIGGDGKLHHNNCTDPECYRVDVPQTMELLV